MNELLIGRILVGVTTFGYFAYKLWEFWRAKKTDQDAPKIEGPKMFTDDVLSHAYDYSTAAQEETIKKFDLGNYDRWHVDQEAASISFYKKTFLSLKRRSKYWVANRLTINPGYGHY